MENKDNNIVVNAKPNIIVLRSTEEEVTGGYYDSEGTWHEFGGGGLPERKRYKLKTVSENNGLSSTYYLGVLMFVEDSSSTYLPTGTEVFQLSWSSGAHKTMTVNGNYNYAQKSTQAVNDSGSIASGLSNAIFVTDYVSDYEDTLFNKYFEEVQDE